VVRRVRTVRGTEYVGTTYRVGLRPWATLRAFARTVDRWGVLTAVFALTLLVPLAVAAAVARLV
jgi:hypothetical protein